MTCRTSLFAILDDFEVPWGIQNEAKSLSHPSLWVAVARDFCSGRTFVRFRVARVAQSDVLEALWVLFLKTFRARVPYCKLSYRVRVSSIQRAWRGRKFVNFRCVVQNPPETLPGAVLDWPLCDLGVGKFVNYTSQQAPHLSKHISSLPYQQYAPFSCQHRRRRPYRHITPPLSSLYQAFLSVNARHFYDHICLTPVVL